MTKLDIDSACISVYANCPFGPDCEQNDCTYCKGSGRCERFLPIADLRDYLRGEPAKPTPLPFDPSDIDALLQVLEFARNHGFSIRLGGAHDRVERLHADLTRAAEESAKINPK